MYNWCGVCPPTTPSARSVKENMSILNDLKKLARPYDEDEDEFDDFSANAIERVPTTPKTVAQSRVSYGGFEDRTNETNKVVNIHATAQLQVVLVKPERYENVTEIADHLKDKRTVVLNLEQTNRETARRILDFMSGAAYAQQGKIKKIAVNTFLITPYYVDLMGEDDLIDELENKGLNF